jgi:tetratricopeptide (TPR) repeat protein
MNIPYRYRRFATLSLGALLLGLSLSVCAEEVPPRTDEVQAANKLFKQGKYDQALEKIDVVLGAKPRDVQARFLKGLILTAQGKSSAAIAIFTALTEDFPDQPEPYNNLAVLHAAQGQYDKAKAALEMAVRIQPNYANAHENLGDIYARMASKEYERAQQLDRNNHSAQAKLALIKQFAAPASGGNAAPSAPVAASAPAATGGAK